MTSNEIKALDRESVMQTYARLNVVIDRGEGSTLYSPEGKEYIDFSSGIGVNCLGYGDRKWADAVYTQAMKLQHLSNLYYSEPYVRLAHELTIRTGMKNAFFGNSGAEANEGMIKLARKYSHTKYGKGRATVITLRQSFHGRTITTLAATGQDSFHKNFFPFTEGFRYAPANDIAALESELRGDVCAVMLELIQGEGGVLPLDAGYVKAVRKLCDERDVLLLIDEVQTGVGRTGTLFAFQQYGVMPDVMTFAKGIAGGLPMGGFLAGDKCAAVLSAGDHAATFGGNPIAAAGAIEVLSRMTPEFLDGVVERGEYIKKAVSGWGRACAHEMRGRGLMLGLPVMEKPREIAEKCAEMGLIILTAGSDALRMLPPLNISYKEIDKGLVILKTVLEGF